MYYKKEKMESVIGTEVESLDEKGLKEVSIAAHKEDQINYDISENAMCFIVLGSILAIIGVLFLFLSLKRRMNVWVGINFEGFQFYVFLVFTSVGVACLIYGLIRLIIAKGRRKKVNDLIAAINYKRLNAEADK